LGSKIYGKGSAYFDIARYVNGSAHNFNLIFYQKKAYTATFRMPVKGFS
jgi:hypothetical protein